MSSAKNVCMLHARIDPQFWVENLLIHLWNGVCMFITLSLLLLLADWHEK